MSLIALDAESWTKVTRRVGRYGHPLRWAWAAVRGVDGVWQLGALSVVGGAPVEPAFLRYGDVAFGVEPVGGTTAARRLRAGRVVPAARLRGLAFEVPGGEYRPLAVGSDGHPGLYLAPSGWPQYFLTVTLGGEGHFGARLGDPLHAPGLPFYPTVAAAIGELVLGVDSTTVQRHTLPQVVIRLPDMRARLRQPAFDEGTLIVPIETGVGVSLDGWQLRCAWRRDHRDPAWSRVDLPAAEAVPVETGELPMEMTMLLESPEGEGVDRGGWEMGAGAPTGRPSTPEAQLEEWLRQGEGPQLEYKQQLGKPKVNQSFAETVAAFANGEGGTILVGVADDGTVVGHDTEKPDDQVQSIVRDQVRDQPHVTVTPVSYGERPVLVVWVAPGDLAARPFRSSGQVMVRVGATTRQARTDEIRALAREVVPPLRRR